MDLNDAGCDIISYDARRERYAVEVQGSSERVDVRRANLRPQSRRDADGVFNGAGANRPDRANLMDEDFLRHLDPRAFASADAARPAPAGAGPASPMLDAGLEPQEMFRTANDLTRSGEYRDAAGLYLGSLLINWSLNASSFRPARRAVAGLPADDPCGLVLGAVVRLWDQEGEPEGARRIGSYEDVERIMAGAIRALGRSASVVGISTTAPQRPPPTILVRGAGASPPSVPATEVHRGRFAMCCAKVFHGRLACLTGPYSVEAWRDARRTIVQGIAYMDPERCLALQYELAYTARDVGDNVEALKWYEMLVANGEGRPGMSDHWRTFLQRVAQEARQLRYEREDPLLSLLVARGARGL